MDVFFWAIDPRVAFRTRFEANFHLGGNQGPLFLNGLASPRVPGQLQNSLTSALPCDLKPVTRPGRGGLSPPLPKNSSVGVRQIINNRFGILFRDGGAVHLDHLGHLGLPEIPAESWTMRLSIDIVGRMAGGAILLRSFHPRA